MSAPRRRSRVPWYAAPRHATILILVSALTAPRASADWLDDVRKAWASGDLPAARAAVEARLAERPDDPAALYESAALLAREGADDAGAARLVDAISYGFVDLGALERDARFTPLHDQRDYKAIRLGWRDLLDARGDAEFRAAAERFGPGYRSARDEGLRLSYVCAFDERTLGEARAEVANVARWAEAIFGPTPGPDDPRPPAWVVVIAPTPEDFVRVGASSGVGAGVGGFYDHDRRRLIAQDLGPSFRHEFFHVLHWRAMTARGQRHPDWIMEGLASLMEDVDPAGEGSIAPAPSWRTTIVKRLEAGGRLLPLARLFAMDRERFVGARPLANYAQARAFMLFLCDRGVLPRWWRDYTETFAQDPTGAHAVERALGSPLPAVERDYRAWLRALPEAAERLTPGMASLGVVISAGRGDGPRIDDIEAGSPARAAGLRIGDVITVIDGRSTRTLEDLVRVLAEFEVGDEVAVSARRGSLRVEARVVLSAMAPTPGR